MTDRPSPDVPIQQTVRRLASALAAALSLHFAPTGSDECATCKQAWPCQTYDTIQHHLGNTDD